MNNIQATIITIGDELLIGQTIDTNSAWMGQKLNALGINVRRRIAIADSREAIFEALNEELGKARILLLTGGLGPTSDDITKPCLCEYFGGKLVMNEEVLAHVKEMFSKRNRPFLERNGKQAEVPDVCTVISNRLGTAPGMWFEKDGTVVVSLPGVPFEMTTIMEEEVLPRLLQRFPSDALIHRTIVTAGEGESFLAERIKDLEEALPAHIHLAYLPQYGGVRLRLTGSGTDAALLTSEIEQRRDALVERLHDVVVATEDLPMEHILAKALLATGNTAGLAESCTGGYIAHKLTQISGSSDYFRGSLVCYHNNVKEAVLGVKQSTIEQYTVVSEEVAVEMAAGARKRLGSTIGFGVTGLLSPSEEYSVPTGTVCMAITDGERVVSKTHLFHLDRPRNKELAVHNAMLMIWRFVYGKI